MPRTWMCCFPTSYTRPWSSLLRRPSQRVACRRRDARVLPIDSKHVRSLTPRAAAGIGAAGGLLVVITAPFAALADAPFSPGGWQSLPRHAAALHEVMRPAFEFADPVAVLRWWEAPLALGFALIAASSVPLGKRSHSRDRLVGFLVVAATALLAALAMGIGLEVLLGPETPGTILYFIATPLAPLAACLAGGLALQRQALPRAAAWALVAAPPAMLASGLLLPQFPAGTGLGLAVAWTVAVLAGSSSDAPGSHPPHDQRG